MTTNQTCFLLFCLAGYEFQRETGHIVLSPAAQADKTMQWTNGVTMNKVAHETLPKHSIPIIPAFNISAPLVDNHVGLRNSPSLDCLHYCSPGVPEVIVILKGNNRTSDL